MVNPIKIFFVYHTSMIGGGSYCLLNILKEIDREHFLPVVTLGGDGPLVGEIRNLGIKVYIIKKIHVVPYNESTLTPRRIRNAFEIIASLRDFERVLKNEQPDIVYINTMMLYPYLRVAKKMGLKTVVHVREHWPNGEHIWQRNLAINHIKKYADRIVAINSYSLSMFDDALQPKIIVYDWIDLSGRSKPMSFKDIFKEEMKDKKVYLYMGGLQLVKGPLEVLKVFTQEVKDSNARLLVMGIIPGAMTGGLKGIIKNVLSKLGYETYSKRVMDLIVSDPRIRCIPGTYDVRNIFEQTYCILSYFTIPHANLALAESIISGTVNIAARTPESIEYSCNGQLAILYDFNQIDSFRTAVRQLDSHYNAIRNKINMDSHYVADMFDKKSNVERLMNFLNF